MENAEIRRIADYIKGLEKGLYDWNSQGILLERHLTEVHLALERLMDLACNVKDQQLRALLSALEYRARNCEQCLRVRLAVNN